MGARILMYRVGFGDFFLLSVPANGGLAHVLIDCGVHANDIGAMPAALQQMEEDTGGHLDLVIMTHRHADHISGFGTGKAVFEQITVERVWMSWFEDPGDKTAFAIQAGLAAVAQRLQSALTARAAGGDRQYANMAGNILGLSGAGLSSAGLSSNAVALDVLHSFKTAAGDKTPIDFYRAGDAAILPPVLVAAGLTAQILGPPTDLALVAKMDNAAHQYLAEDDGDAGPTMAPFADVFISKDYAWPAGPPPLFELAEVEKHIGDSQPDALAAAAQKADNAINNQSLVVLFTFDGKTMLFSGDAQWGNWANFLFGGPLGTPGHTGLTDASRAILGSLDFYKVGHHGSTNATPIDVINALRLGCVAMCSTDPGAYGKVSSGTEVPRIPLLKALSDRTNGQLARSDQVPAGTATTVDAALGPLSRVFAPSLAHGFIDYEF